MRKSRKVILWGFLFVLIIFFGATFIYRYLNDSSRLSPAENEWINNNLNKVQNVSVLNDTNVFGLNGTGVFYDFLDDFSTQYGLKMNAITYNSAEQGTGIQFGISNDLKEESVSFYEDHYVLVAKKHDSFFNERYLEHKKVGVIQDSLTYVSEQLETLPEFIPYSSKGDLLKALEQDNVEAVLVPRIEYIDSILSKNYSIIYHFTNLIRYYHLTLDSNEGNLSSVLVKYFNKWKEEQLLNILREQEFQLFIQNLSISQTEVDRLQGNVYNYGFMNISPYEIMSGGNYGGILATYLDEFSKFSKVEFHFKRYKNYKKLTSDIQDNKINLYFGYYNNSTSFTDVNSNLVLAYDILAPIQKDDVITSLKSLKGKTIYVENNSFLQSILQTLENVTVKTYNNEKELKKIIKAAEIIVMDHHIANFYLTTLLKDYSVRYTSYFDTNYAFKVQANESFVKLFTKYLDFLDENKMIFTGSYHHKLTLKTGTILGTIAKYFIYIFLLVVVILLLIYRSSKKVRLANKIRREDKMKFIDQLTSLKNRNYLNENIGQWNKNTIYPQSMIVIDLNRIQDINDTVSYEQGDAQIKATANILVKTQLDNSDIMRTDGNEFMIYLVGYQTKQITSYIHKLNKEFKNLPYSYGAAIGYSMIVDDIKSLEDAINEAIEDVRKQKGLKKEEQL